MVDDGEASHVNVACIGSPSSMHSLVLGLILLVGTSGCATVEIVPSDRLNEQKLTEDATPIAHIYVTNWGWSLFKYIPFLTGNLDRPGAPRFPVFGTDNVKVDVLVQKITETSKSLGANFTTDLRTRDRSYWMPWTLIFWLEEKEVSANASTVHGD